MRSHVIQVSRAHCVDQSFHRGAVDKRLELRPTFKTVRAGNHELCVVQRERARIRAVIVRVHLGGRNILPVLERLEQFLGLAFQLIEVGPLAQDAGGDEWSRHDDLLPGRRLAVHRPVSAQSGRKEFIEAAGCRSRLRGTQSFPRTRWRPDAQSESLAADGGALQGGSLASAYAEIRAALLGRGRPSEAIGRPYQSLHDHSLWLASAPAVR